VATIFDRLDGAGLSWRIYAGVWSWAICPSLADCLYTAQHANTAQPTQLLADAKAGTLPAYSILTPGILTSQHNKMSMAAGDNSIGQVVTALEAGPEWNSTAIFVIYDDCGCFYDHARPGVNPDGTGQGIRVPMVIVSPYARPGFTDHTPATFASILRYTEETFSLPALGVNDGGAYDYRAAFNYAQRPLPGARLNDHPVPAASADWLSRHPQTDDPT
jgi:phospholipase C